GLIKNLDAKVSSLTNSNKENTRWAYTSSTSPSRFKSHTKPPYSGLTFDEVKSLFPEDLNQVMFRDGAMTIGKYIGKTEEGDLMFMNNRSLFTCNDNEFDRSTLQVI
ncbi:hypothetical protein, partial [Cronobacter dublinensis]|uniref:hypothetical protein n=1 Tax=Cronobacter dublinensis TaxID=413497 RepID=UPI00131A2E10